MERTSIHFRDEQAEVIEEVHDVSTSTDDIPALSQSKVVRMLVDAGIERLSEEGIEVESPTRSGTVDVSLVESARGYESETHRGGL